MRFKSISSHSNGLHALAVDDVIEADKVKKTSPKLHYNSDQVPINLPAIVGCLNWIALRTRPDIAWATSRAASLIIHDPDLCFIRVKHICQYLHHTLGYALRYVPIPPQSKQKLWVLGDASFAPTGEKSQQGIVVYHGITSNQRQGGNLVQWRSSSLQQGENISIVISEMINASCDIEVSSDNAAALGASRLPQIKEDLCLVLEINLASRWEGVRLPRASGKFPGFPGSSPNFPEVFRRLPRRFSHCGTKQQSRGSPEVSRTSPEVSQTSPEVSRTSPEVSPFSGEPDTLS